MKIDLGGGVYMEPDEPPRDSQWHKRIVGSRPIANTRSGNWCELECGHRVMTFGNLELGGGFVLCTKCRDGSHE